MMITMITLEINILAKTTHYSTCYCTVCNHKFPISRANTRAREKGHLKSLYCVNCRQTTNHLEIRDSDFVEEARFLYKDWKRYRLKPGGGDSID